MRKYLELGEVKLDETVENFLRAKSLDTARAYRVDMKRFQMFLGRPVSEFVREVEEQRIKNKDVPADERRRFFEETMNSFIKWMQAAGYSNNPIRGSLAALQNLFKYLDVPISYSFMQIPPPLAKKSNGKHKWTVEDIKNFIVKSRSYRDKAIILVMFQSGMAVNEICELDYGDVEHGLKTGELPLLLDLVRKKNSNPFKTLIGADAVKYLKLYLDTRGELKSSDPLFSKEGSNVRINTAIIQSQFRELTEEVFGIRDKAMNPYRPHSLRAAFRSKLTGKADTDLVKFWMGDVLGPKAGAYLNLSDEDHREQYTKVERYLSIETTSEELQKGKVEGTDSVRVNSLRGQLSELEKERELDKKEIEGLTKAVDRLKATTEELAEKLGSLTALEERIAELEDLAEIGALRGEVKRIEDKKAM